MDWHEFWGFRNLATSELQYLSETAKPPMDEAFNFAIQQTMPQLNVSPESKLAAYRSKHHNHSYLTIWDSWDIHVLYVRHTLRNFELEDLGENPAHNPLCTNRQSL